MDTPLKETEVEKSIIESVNAFIHQPQYRVHITRLSQILGIDITRRIAEHLGVQFIHEREGYNLRYIIPFHPSRWREGVYVTRDTAIHRINRLRGEIDQFIRVNNLKD